MGQLACNALTWWPMDGVKEKQLVLSVYAKIKTGTYTWRSAAQAHGMVVIDLVYYVPVLGGTSRVVLCPRGGAGPSGSDGGWWRIDVTKKRPRSPLLQEGNM